MEKNREQRSGAPEGTPRERDIARTVGAVEAGNLAEGITIPTGEPRRLSDEELGGRAALEAAGLEPTDGWDDELPSVYEIHLGGRRWYVEAARVGDAVEVWRGATGATQEPSGVVLLGEGPVLRKAVRP